MNSNSKTEEPYNYLNDKNGVAVCSQTSQIFNCPASNVLLSDRRAIWLSEPGLPQSITIDLTHQIKRPKFFKCFGFDCWHDYASNPAVIELSVSTDGNNYVCWTIVYPEMRPGVQLFQIDPLGRSYNFLKIVIKETYGAAKTYMNQIFLFEDSPLPFQPKLNSAATQSLNESEVLETSPFNQFPEERHKIESAKAGAKIVRNTGANTSRSNVLFNKDATDRSSEQGFLSSESSNIQRGSLERMSGKSESFENSKQLSRGKNPSRSMPKLARAQLHAEGIRESNAVSPRAEEKENSRNRNTNGEDSSTLSVTQTNDAPNSNMSNASFKTNFAQNQLLVNKTTKLLQDQQQKNSESQESLTQYFSGASLNPGQREDGQGLQRFMPGNHNEDLGTGRASHQRDFDINLSTSMVARSQLEDRSELVGLPLTQTEKEVKRIKQEIGKWGASMGSMEQNIQKLSEKLDLITNAVSNYTSAVSDTKQRGSAKKPSEKDSDVGQMQATTGSGVLNTRESDTRMEHFFESIKAGFDEQLESIRSQNAAVMEENRQLKELLKEQMQRTQESRNTQPSPHKLPPRRSGQSQFASGNLYYTERESCMSEGEHLRLEEFENFRKQCQQIVEERTREIEERLTKTFRTQQQLLEEKLRNELRIAQEKLENEITIERRRHDEEIHSLKRRNEELESLLKKQQEVTRQLESQQLTMLARDTKTITQRASEREAVKENEYFSQQDQTRKYRHIPQRGTYRDDKQPGTTREALRQLPDLNSDRPARDYARAGKVDAGAVNPREIKTENLTEHIKEGKSLNKIMVLMEKLQEKIQLRDQKLKQLDTQSPRESEGMTDVDTYIRRRMDEKKNVRDPSADSLTESLFENNNKERSYPITRHCPV